MGGPTPCPRSGAEAESARLRWRRNVLEELPPSEVRDGGWEDQPHVQGAVAARAQEGLEEPSHIEGQEGWWEEIPFIQGKEQQLCFAGAAVKRYPMPKVRETRVRW